MKIKLHINDLPKSVKIDKSVAIDTETGEVGSAGGSCIAGSIIISDIHPGVGAIHTQSYYLPANQNYASNLMDQGYSPEEIIEYLIESDSQGNPSILQYGVVDLADILLAYIISELDQPLSICKEQILARYGNSLFLEYLRLLIGN